VNYTTIDAATGKRIRELPTNNAKLT